MFLSNGKLLIGLQKFSRAENREQLLVPEPTATETNTPATAPPEAKANP
jgi:hypothetical protein